MMINTLILYDSRYGFTEYIALNLARILGPAKALKIDDGVKDFSKFNSVVLCAPIYMEHMNENVIEFVNKNKEDLIKKKIMILCTCLNSKGIDEYCKPIRDILGESVVWQGAAGGRIKTDKLMNEDADLLKLFCNKLGIVYKDYNIFNKEKFVNLVLAMKNLKDKESKTMESEKLKKYIDEFIRKHNTCSLSTGYKERIRSTPIEYIYLNNNIYMLTEGGEKFANILLNNNVSISIFDSYEGMNKLGGMQITGIAEIIQIGCDEYKNVLRGKRIDYEKIKLLPVALNLIKITPKKIEFLSSQFVKAGYESKQIYFFPIDSHSM